MKRTALLPATTALLATLVTGCADEVTSRNRGVYLLMDDIRQEGKYEMVNLPIAYGTAVLRKRQNDGRPTS